MHISTQFPAKHTHTHRVFEQFSSKCKRILRITQNKLKLHDETNTHTHTNPSETCCVQIKLCHSGGREEESNKILLFRIMTSASWFNTMAMHNHDFMHSNCTFSFTHFGPPCFYLHLSHVQNRTARILRFKVDGAVDRVLLTLLKSSTDFEQQQPFQAVG